MLIPSAVITRPSPRYWESYKDNAASGGFYHTELEVYNGGVVAVSAGALSQSGLSQWDPALLVDGNIVTIGFHTDSAGVGSYMRIDLGGRAQTLNKWRYYVNGNVVALWRIRYSYDAVTWVSAATLDCAGGAGWKEVTW